jgi:hypothetical protein
MMEKKENTWKEYLISYSWTGANDVKGILALTLGRIQLKHFKKTWLAILGIWIANDINELYWYRYFY